MRKTAGRRERDWGIIMLVRVGEVTSEKVTPV